MISELQTAIDNNEPLSKDTRGILKKILVNDKKTANYDLE
jgi:hypothetical protein